MTEYTLYCFAQSGNTYKPALALALAGADWTPRWVDYLLTCISVTVSVPSILSALNLILSPSLTPKAS